MFSGRTFAPKTAEMASMHEGSELDRMTRTTTGEDSELCSGGCDSKIVVFVQIAERRHAQLLWLAQRMTNNREEAEDVLQEALLKAFKSLAQFRGESQMGTWITVIVQNTGREWLRKKRGRVCLPLDDVRNQDNDSRMFDFPDPGKNPEQCYEHGEMKGILLSEIDALNSVSKSAIEMCVLEEHSHLEAANALGVNVFTIKSRIFHGKRMLKLAVCRRIGEQDDVSLSIEIAL
jgi:RNA polymerase sigma-70 factor (ECF subfamily)